MITIFGQIAVIIEYICAARNKAESKKTGDHGFHPERAKKPARKKRRNKQEEILCPVSGPE
jgi:hypothetical protein